LQVYNFKLKKIKSSNLKISRIWKIVFFWA